MTPITIRLTTKKMPIAAMTHITNQITTKKLPMAMTHITNRVMRLQTTPKLLLATMTMAIMITNLTLITDAVGTVTYTDLFKSHVGSQQHIDIMH
jgi:hypothetical protein